MSINPSNLCQIEIPAIDLEKSITFFEQVFQWKAVPIEIHQYIVLETPKECPFGISLIPVSKGSSGRSVTLYFQVEDLAQIASLAERYEGRVIAPERELPGYGAVQIISDPSGNKFGLFQG